MSMFAPKAVILAMSFAAAGLILGRSPSGAADRPAFSVKPIAGIAGAALPVWVLLPKDLETPPVEGPVFVMFRPVPAEIAFSAGFRARQAWLVGIKDLGRLRLLSQPGFAQVIELEAVLYRGRGRDRLTHAVRIDLTGAPADAIPSAGVTGAFPPTPRTHTGKPPTTLAQAEIAELLRRAEGLLGAGDFESARLIYSALADDGLAQAAILMARTFDPEVLKRRFIVGMSPDAGKAMHWYRRAMALGNDGARLRLDMLARQQVPAPP